MNSNKEIQIYEKLGVKAFKKMVLALREVWLYPFTKNMTKEERRQAINSTYSNYNLGRVKTVEDVLRFKKQLALNATIHIIGLLICISDFPRVFGGTCPIPSAIVTLSCTVLNSYCIMLQRYNLIRMNRYIEERKNREKRKIIELERKIQKDITLTQESLKEKTNIEQLQEYREVLLNSFNTREEIIEEEKVLKLKLKKDN